MSSLRNPEELSYRLGLEPFASQIDLMTRFYDDEDPLNVVEVPSAQTVNAVAMCCIWRMLRQSDSKAVVIAANRDLEKRFMSFTRRVTSQVDPAISSLCNWSEQGTMTVGDTSLLPHLVSLGNQPELVKGFGGDTTFVVLGAGSTALRFNATMAKVREYEGQSGARHIYMW